MAITKAAGALMTDAARICTPKSVPSSAIYNARTEPAIVAKPPVIIAFNSERVIFSRYGRTTSGASVCPRKTLAAMAIDSAPDTPSDIFMMRAMAKIRICMSRR